jgi:hypothetical protein
MIRQSNASAKSKELQHTAQSQHFTAYLLLPQTQPSASTTLTNFESLNYK